MGEIIFLLIVGLLALWAYRAKKRLPKYYNISDEDFDAKLAEGRLQYSLLSLSDDVAIREPSRYGYTPVRGEKLLGVHLDSANFDSKIRGRLFVTTKALVFAHGDRTDRNTWSSLAHFELKRDGLELQKARGWRKAYVCRDANFLALAEAAFLEMKSE